MLFSWLELSDLLTLSHDFTTSFTLGIAAPQADHLRLREWAACLDDDLQRFVQVMNIEALAVAPDEQIDWANLITSATIIDPGRATELGIIQNVEAATIPTDSIRWWVL
jgi:hypothetical protein